MLTIGFERRKMNRKRETLADFIGVAGYLGGLLLLVLGTPVVTLTFQYFIRLIFHCSSNIAFIFALPFGIVAALGFLYIMAYFWFNCDKIADEWLKDDDDE